MVVCGRRAWIALAAVAAAMVAGCGARAPSSGPAAELTIWPQFAARTVMDDSLAPVSAPRELVLAAPLNGVASGQVVVHSPQAIGALKASCGALAGPSGPLPASSVRLRYLTNQPLVSPELLLDASAPAGPCTTIADAFIASGQTTQAVFVTVEPPADAAPGEYTGEVRIETDRGQASMPVRLTVVDFVLPAPADLDIWMAMSFSPTQLAYYYQVPHYSEAHWEKIEQQLERVGRLGNHVLYLPVLWFANNGSGPQLVTFSEQGGKLTPNFDLLDRYLALVKKHLGPQRRVVLGVWGRWQHTSNRSTRTPRTEVQLTGRTQGGGYEMISISSDYTENAELWKAVYDGVAERVASLGVPAGHILLGGGDDLHPNEADDAAWRKIAPRCPGWQAWTHNYGDPGPRPVLLEIVDTGSGRAPPGEGADALRGGWDAADRVPLFLCTVRDSQRDGLPPVIYFSVPDVSVGRQKMGETVGLARIGLDYWPKRVPWSRSPEDGYNGGSPTAPRRVDRSKTTTLTAPGPGGPVPLLHYEALREGIQAAQARILVEKALAAKVGDAGEYERALRTFWAQGTRLGEFYTTSDYAAFEALGGWGEGARAIYTAAGDAQRQLNLRPAALDSAARDLARRRAELAPTSAHKGSSR